MFVKSVPGTTPHTRWSGQQAFKCFVLAAALWMGGGAQAQTLADLRQQLDAPWKAKDWPAVEALARQIVAQPQSNTGDRRNLAWALAGQGKKEEAFAVRQELAKRPDAKSADHTSICWHYLEKAQAQTARPACQKAVDLDSGSYAALVNLGHSFLLTVDPKQAMLWYRKALQYIQKEEELQRGPLADFKLFIEYGWAEADAQAAKKWFEQTWPQLLALRHVRGQAIEQAKQGQPLAGMRQLLAARTQAIALLGDGAEGNRYLNAYASVAREALDDLIGKQHQHAQALAFVDQALQDAGANLPRERRQQLLSELQIGLRADGERGMARKVGERIDAEHSELVRAQDEQIKALDERIKAQREEKAQIDAARAAQQTLKNLMATYKANGRLNDA